MSRLFEALSALKAEDVTPEVTAPLAVAPPAAGAVLPEPKQELKTGRHSLKIVPPPAAVPDPAQPEPVQEVDVHSEAPPEPVKTIQERAIWVYAPPESRLVALTHPNGLGAEKFRALVTRFDHLRKQGELKSFQITSSVINEGKTLVAGNVAITFAKYLGSKTLLVEGDLHRPTLTSILGTGELRGLSQWWSGRNQDLGQYIHKLGDLPLWFLPAGKPHDQPSDLLRSARFMEAYSALSNQFEWTVVDSTPMLPIVDVNLWSRLVDGTVLVVREGITPVNALKRGLRALDHPKLIGVVVNDATEFDQVGYEGQYYGGSGYARKSVKKR